MLIIAAIAAVLCALSLWMTAHWFVRAVVFVFLAISSCGIIALCDAYPNRGFAIPIAIIVSWLIASIPTYLYRYRARSTSLELALR